MATVINQFSRPTANRQDALELEFSKWLKQTQEKLTRIRNQIILNRVPDLRNEAKAKNITPRGAAAA